MIQGSFEWRNTFLILAGLWLVVAILRGWSNGLLRQLLMIAAFLAAGFLVFQFAGGLADYLRGKANLLGIAATPAAACLIWILAFNLIMLVGRRIFRPVREYDSLPIRIFLGAGGAMLGLAYGLASLWLVLIGIRVAGQIAADQLELQTDRAPSALMVDLVKLRNSTELGVGRPLLDAIDPVPRDFYRELDQCSRLLENPRAIEKMIEYPGFRRLLRNPKLLAIENDPEIISAARNGNLAGILTDRRVIALLNDPELRMALSKQQLEAALDYALNSP